MTAINDIPVLSEPTVSFEVGNAFIDDGDEGPRTFSQVVSRAENVGSDYIVHFGVVV